MPRPGGGEMEKNKGKAYPSAMIKDPAEEIFTFFHNPPQNVPQRLRCTNEHTQQRHHNKQELSMNLFVEARKNSESCTGYLF